jgi:lipoprotein NlpI
MNCRLYVFLLLAAAVPKLVADEQEQILHDALRAAKTNTTAALQLCNQAVTKFPTNAQPLTMRARVFEQARRYDEAIRDLSAALKLEPNTAGLWQGRGEINFKAGHFKESVADFDRVLELSPKQAPFHWQRGISLYYAGRFADGRKQFELHRTVNPNDVENAVWHFLCAAREGGVTNARAAMLPVGADARVPMKEIYALFRGTGSEESVLSAALIAARNPRQRDALMYAHLYLGLYSEVSGDAPMAREHMEKAVNEFAADHYMGDVARVHLRGLNTASGDATR